MAAVVAGCKPSVQGSTLPAFDWPQRCIRVIDGLAAQALLDVDPPTRRLRMRIRLNVDAGDVRQALLVRLEES